MKGPVLLPLRRLRVNLIGWRNRGGLRQDLEILEEQFRAWGATVSVTSWQGRGRWLQAADWALGFGPYRYDLNIFLERTVPSLFGRARQNWLIPNPEWLEIGADDRNGLNRILAKSRHAASRLASLGIPVTLTGFTSRDKWAGSRPVDRGAIHIAGRSWQKGTEALLSLWKRHPDWPTLTVLHRPSEHGGTSADPMVENVHYLSGYVDDATVRSLQTAIAMHICPSEAEGFGHTINEGLGIGAIVLTTDAPPMNELVTPERGILMRWTDSEPMRFGDRYFVDVEDMEERVRGALELSPLQAGAFAEKARAWFVENDRRFRSKLLSLCIESTK